MAFKIGRLPLAKTALHVLLCPWRLQPDVVAITAHKGLGSFALGSNMIAKCSNKSAYVGVAIFASCSALPDLILPSLHLHGSVYFNTFLGMLVMSVFALGCDVRASTSRSSGVIR